MVKNLVKSLQYYVSGDEQARARQAIQLLEDFKKEKALDFIRKSYRTAGIQQIERIQVELDQFIAEEKKVVEKLIAKKVEQALVKDKPVKAKKVAKKKVSNKE